MDVMALFDTHAHLDFPYLHEQIEDIFERMDEADVQRVVTIGASRGLESNVRALAIAEKYDHVHCTVGIHPHDADMCDDAVFDKIANEFASHPKVVGIGETGLDYFYDNADRDQQKRVFRRFIRLANELNKPVIIHARDADRDTVDILREEGAKNGILHCFTGGREMAEELVAPDLDFYISFSGIATFKKSEALREIAAEIVPANRILVETDSPYLAPSPHRGKKNEPSYVKFTAECLAEATGTPFEEFSQQTFENACRVFNL